ncbi:acyl-CoA dehydrogenase family protein [Natrinema salsiterrestre]|uniref:Acyl-CoA dehydrogenase family protein n=1 Tax=Natrinema salsiterrestre TaxID=2950540 RepID=A0A9Q4Q542_9EURY|nr:acyl-CoA dehydrogenase family protein [Natrinema salsiterrestre]MDF9747828.1 acyl-CoA dehydrogenase family protein [Natrinema salsiterrestre]
MTTALTAEHEAIRDAVREFAETEIEPVARDYDEPGVVQFPREIFQDAADLDFLAPHYPEEYGGAGMDFLASVIVHEEFNRADPGIGTAVLTGKFGTELLLEYGEDWQKDEFLRPVLEGEAVCGTSISEPDAGSDVAGMRTTAEKDGDEWVLNGSKTWASNSPVAEFMIVMAKTTPDAGHDGISAFIVPTETDGFEVGRDIEKMGLRASPTAEINISDARVPDDYLVGEEDRGFIQLMKFFNENRILVAANALGAAAGAFRHAFEYAHEREAFDQKIGEFQGLQWKLADMMTGIETARSTTYRAAGELMAGNDPRRLASIAKYYTSEVCEDVCSEAVQIHGGYGYTREFPVEKFYRDSRVQKIVEGTSEIQKNIIYDSLE